MSIYDYNLSHNFTCDCYLMLLFNLHVCRSEKEPLSDKKQKMPKSILPPLPPKIQVWRYYNY